MHVLIDSILIFIIIIFPNIEDDDFTAVPSGAVLGDNPPRYQTVTFAPNSVSVEICVSIAQDLLACEEEEMFQIELTSVDACGGMTFTHVLVSIEDSTRKMIAIKYKQIVYFVVVLSPLKDSTLCRVCLFHA